jgi:surface carbohydrate biosynthesis protein
VLKAIIKFFRFIVKNRYSKIYYSKPSKAKIAILDGSNVQYLIPLCGDEKYTTIDVNGEQLYLTLEIIFSMFKWTVKTHDPQLGYVITLLEIINPSITITFVDNATLFYEVSRRYHHCRFLAIQNAARYDTAHLESKLAKEIHIPEFACFGDYEKDLYTKIGAKVNQFYPIGSVRDSYYRNIHAVEDGNIDYDICLVSEPSPGWDQIEFPGFEDAIGTIAKYAVQFSQKYNKKLCIAGKRDPETTARDAELKWYEKYIGKNIDIIPRVREEYTTYKLIDRSAVSISFVSTALQEGLGRGNRVLFCNYTGYKHWSFPVNGIWLLEESSYDSFEKQLLILLGMTDEQFRQQSAMAAKYVLNYNEEIPTDVYLGKIITGAVSDKVTPQKTI